MSAAFQTPLEFIFNLNSYLIPTSNQFEAFRILRICIYLGFLPKLKTDCKYNNTKNNNFLILLSVFRNTLVTFSGRSSGFSEIT